MSKKWKKPGSTEKRTDGDTQPTATCRYDPTAIHTIRIQPHPEGNQWKTDQKEYWRKQLKVAKWLNIITAIAAGFAAMYAFIAYLQMRQLGNNFSRDERAWVTVSEAKLFTPYIEKQPLQIELTITNTGKTPATNIRKSTAEFSTDSLIGGPSEEMKKALQLEPFGALAPQGKRGMQIVYFSAADPAIYQAIKDHKRFVFFIGELRYDDIFGETHSSSYCVYYFTGLRPGDSLSEVDYCSTFNDMH